MKQQHLADSVLNRILNFMADLDEPALPNPAMAGAQLDAALAAPVAPAAPDPNMPGLAEGLVAQGLGLPPQ